MITGDAKKVSINCRGSVQVRSFVVPDHRGGLPNTRQTVVTPIRWRELLEDICRFEITGIKKGEYEDRYGASVFDGDNQPVGPRVTPPFAVMRPVKVCSGVKVFETEV